MLDVNKIEIPILNSGVTADANDLLPQSGARYEEGRFLFSGGFLLSGYSNDTLWANGAMSSSIIEDYLLWTSRSNSKSNKYKIIYCAEESDVPFETITEGVLESCVPVTRVSQQYVT
ncbi:MAG: hypothetical protein MZV64_02540, partial [Ignavibacteriales bacterium]|nr:hypothetical protein [Ignavibacteriales bacterium]